MYHENVTLKKLSKSKFVYCHEKKKDYLLEFWIDKIIDN